MARKSLSIEDVLVNKLDKLENRFDKIESVLEDIKRQTTLTNGRVNALEKFAIDSTNDRKDLREEVYMLKSKQNAEETVRKELVQNTDRYERKTSDTMSHIRNWITAALALISIILTLVFHFIK